MQVQSLGQEDPLEKEMSTCSSILAWKMLWTEEPVRGVAKSRTGLALYTGRHTFNTRSLLCLSSSRLHFTPLPLKLHR